MVRVFSPLDLLFYFILSYFIETMEVNTVPLPHVTQKLTLLIFNIIAIASFHLLSLVGPFFFFFLNIYLNKFLVSESPTA